MQQYELSIRASGEVHDAEGNLISSEPVEARLTLTAEQLAALGLTPKDAE